MTKKYKKIIYHKNTYLIVIVLFILPFFSSIILKHQYYPTNKNQTLSKITSFFEGFDVLCYRSCLGYGNQMFSLVGGLEGYRISSINSPTDRFLFIKKRLINQIKELNTFSLTLLKYRFFEFKEYLEELQAKKNRHLQLSHGKDNLAFMKGLVLGEKSPEAHYIPSFSNAGMLHVLVASGFNVALIAGLAWYGVKNRSKKWQLFGVLTVIWGYAFYLEFEPPILRATWMFSMLFLLRFLGVKTKKFRILLFSIVMIVLLQPALISSISLWLSAFATLGILVFAQRLSLLWQEDVAVGTNLLTRIKTIFLEESTTSLAAQSLIFPILLWVFHSANFVSFLANPILLPWLGMMTQLAGGEFLLSFLEDFWVVRVLLGALGQAMSWVFDQYLAAVAWWKPFFFLNQSVGQTQSGVYLAFWAGIIAIFFLSTRKKQETKSSFFHENA